MPQINSIMFLASISAQRSMPPPLVDWLPQDLCVCAAYGSNCSRLMPSAMRVRFVWFNWGQFWTASNGSQLVWTGKRTTALVRLQEPGIIIPDKRIVPSTLYREYLYIECYTQWQREDNQPGSDRPHRPGDSRPVASLARSISPDRHMCVCFHVCWATVSAKSNWTLISKWQIIPISKEIHINNVMQLSYNT